MMKVAGSMEEYHKMYQESIENPEKFWNEIASSFIWRKKWDKVLEWEFNTPKIEWFINGKLNITENCLDRHLKDKAHDIALIWEPNDPSSPFKTYTYQELFHEVNKTANLLKQLGVQKGDRVCIYLPMIPELVFAVLACARIGAIHSVVFAGFSARSLADRINDSGCRLVITSDWLYRGNKTLCLKSIMDEALENCPDVKQCLVLLRDDTSKVKITPHRDIIWNELIDKQKNECPAEIMDSEDPLFILYTSGSTGKPKGVEHHCGGYMVWAEFTFRNVFQYKPGEIFFCTADIGWITGHTYLVYGPLLAGAKVLMFEGIPTWPDPGRFWQIVDKHQVNIFYTAPTAIRSLMAHGTEFIKPYDLSSLRVLGTVGEPINEEAWHWYHEHIGKKRCPIVDTWWQTETGGIMISPLAGITPEKPSYATLPLPGVQPVLVDSSGNEITEPEAEGNLCIKFPWPGMIRSTWGDHERCRQTYFSTYPGKYFTGDGAKREKNGYYRIIGRVDDVINVSGHRIGTAEVENAIDEHPLVIESAVVGFPHPVKGQGIYAFCILDQHQKTEQEKIRNEIIELVSKVIGPIAKPDIIQFVSGLPKTRSGKIMRRILRKIAERDFNNLGDTSTLLDPSVVQEIIDGSRQYSMHK
ncbi:MAG: acetyl-coenzyme A synthetase [Vicingaceae bacterium]|nr:MAG: acetyl-coenzyme A synthetase [Vicingaceae bacterium]